ncbi:unnamed protein product [Didymodactylos carnosus]|nr:unnamed protein product [Didymodactylos carnosus]CAF3746925.1 unnamed protein product [Didymodactylos carnosus]
MFVAGPDENVYLLVKDSCAIVDELRSNYIEADTRIFLHINHISSFKNFLQVVVQATDTGIIVLAIGFALEYGIKLYVNCSTSRRKVSKLVDCTAIAHRCFTDHKFQPILWIVLRALSGCDTTSFMRNISKQKLFRTFFKQPAYYLDLLDMYKLTNEFLIRVEQLVATRRDIGKKETIDDTDKDHSNVEVRIAISPDN